MFHDYRMSVTSDHCVSIAFNLLCVTSALQFGRYLVHFLSTANNFFSKSATLRFARFVSENMSCLNARDERGF